MIDLKSEKARVRKDIRDQLKILSVGQRHEWSVRITKRLLELPEYRQAKVVMVFLSFPKEYDTEPVILNGLSAGKTVCAPKVDWQAWKMEPVKLAGLDEIANDMHGLLEPTGDQKVDVDLIDLVLVPGLAFDTSGHRLGRGGAASTTPPSPASICGPSNWLRPSIFKSGLPFPSTPTINRWISSSPRPKPFALSYSQLALCGSRGGLFQPGMQEN